MPDETTIIPDLNTAMSVRSLAEHLAKHISCEELLDEILTAYGEDDVNDWMDMRDTE